MNTIRQKLRHSLLAIGFTTFLSPTLLAEESKGTTDDWKFSHLNQDIRVLTYQPESIEASPLIVLFHGSNRDVVGYHRTGQLLADRLGMRLAVPEFDRERFKPEAFQEGGAVTKEKKLTDAATWTFTYVQPLLEAVERVEEKKASATYLIGHSAGAQFLNRMAAMAPEPVDRIIVVNAGAYVFPSKDMPYPYGFGNLPDELSGEDVIKRYLAAPMTIYIGSNDTDSKQMPKGEFAMKQGANRVERAHRVFEEGRKLAEEKSWPFGWTLVEAEGPNHGSAAMWRHPQLERAVFGKDQ